jgi:MFS family permease
MTQQADVRQSRIARENETIELSATTLQGGSPGLDLLWKAVASNWSAMPVLMAGTFIVVLDFFIVNVALPSMQVSLHASTSTLEWVIAGYGLTFPVFLVTAGRLADQIGRRRMFSLGLAIFALASIACGVSREH